MWCRPLAGPDLSEIRHFNTELRTLLVALYALDNLVTIACSAWDPKVILRNDYISRSKNKCICRAHECALMQVITNLGGGMGEGHCGHVSCLGMASDGSALCTGSWDTSLKVSVFLGVDYKLTVFTDWISVPAALE